MPHTILLVTLALVLFPSSATSEPEADPVSVVDQLIGVWEGEGHLFGRDAAFDMTWEWVLGDRFLKLSFSNGMKTDEGVRPVIQAQAFYKPLEDHRYEGSWFDSRGVVQPLKGMAEASSLTVEWGSPETEEGRTIYRVLDEDHLRVEDFVKREGEWHGFGEAGYRRVEGSVPKD